MTFTAIFVIPFALLMICLSVRQVLLALFLLLVMTDASIANLGSLSVNVAWFFVLLVVFRVLVTLLTGMEPLDLRIVQRMGLLFWFAVLVLTVFCVAQVLFENNVIVLPGAGGFLTTMSQPYSANGTSNFNQIVYLGVILCFVYALAHLTSRVERPDLVRMIDRAMIGSCLFASFAIFWHMASNVDLVPFADSFFHSDATSKAWKQGFWTEDGGIKRVSGAFTEPSGIAYHYGAYLAYFWRSYTLTKAPRALLMLLLCLAVMLVSTSTTCYIVIVLVAAVTVGAKLLDMARHMGGPRRTAPAFRSRRRGFALHYNTLIGIGIVVAAVAGGYLFFLKHSNTVNTVYESMVVNKASSSSYEERSNSNKIAVDIIKDTWGIGIGLGSHRATSGMLGLVANTGFLGFALLMLFFLKLMNVFSLFRTDDPERDTQPLRWALGGLLLVHMFSAPEFQQVFLFTLASSIIGLQVSGARIKDAAMLRLMLPGARPETSQPRLAAARHPHGGSISL